MAARGCAYVVMVHRSDAVRALSGLKDARLYGSQVKVCLLSSALCNSNTFQIDLTPILFSLLGRQGEESKVFHFVPTGT